MQMNSSLPTPPPAERRRLRDKRGFTIFEVSMAAFIMAMGIATSLIVMQRGFGALDLARGTTLASQVLQSEMESIRLMNWTTVNAMAASSTVDLTTVFTTDPTLASKFTLTRTVSDVAGRVGEMKEIVLSVSWKTIDGKTHTRSFRTIYCKDGLYDYYYTVAGHV
jgi:Tfp pilus assembly protein PilV